MFQFLVFLAVALAVSSSAAGSYVQMRRSPITLPIARRLNTTGVRKVLQRDQIRAQNLKMTATSSNVASGCVDMFIDDEAVDYVASIGVGSPPTFCAWLMLTILD